MRTKNKSIEVGASHEGSRRRKTTPAKSTKSKASVATLSSNKRKPAKRISGPMGTRVFGVCSYRGTKILIHPHVDLEEHISFKLTLKQIRGRGNNDKCATWYNTTMHDSVKAKVKQVAFLPILSILGHGKKGDMPLLVALA
ncbi:unnamed protein product [Prunus brigantina]